MTISGERADLLDTLAKHRYFLRHTAEGLTDEQARTASTVSALTVGGLIKHVAATEQGWIDCVRSGRQEGFGGEYTAEAVAAHQAGFVLGADETLAGALAEYERVAAATDELVRSGLDLDASFELAEAPWQPPGVFWTNRRVLLHIVAETAQHAGHADIVRESIDGQKSMG